MKALSTSVTAGGIAGAGASGKVKSCRTSLSATILSSARTLRRMAASRTVMPVLISHWLCGSPQDHSPGASA